MFLSVQKILSTFSSEFYYNETGLLSSNKDIIIRQRKSPKAVLVNAELVGSYKMKHFIVRSPSSPLYGRVEWLHPIYSLDRYLPLARFSSHPRDPIDSEYLLDEITSDWLVLLCYRGIPCCLAFLAMIFPSDNDAGVGEDV
ncbi:hypothetical protein CBL_02391 [Carabus blaptoides fortunei]